MTASYLAGKCVPLTWSKIEVESFVRKVLNMTLEGVGTTIREPNTLTTLKEIMAAPTMDLIAPVVG